MFVSILMAKTLRNSRMSQLLRSMEILPGCASWTVWEGNVDPAAEADSEVDAEELAETAWEVEVEVEGVETSVELVEAFADGGVWETLAVRDSPGRVISWPRATGPGKPLSRITAIAAAAPFLRCPIRASIALLP
jgi:hypothetical protein